MSCCNTSSEPPQPYDISKRIDPSKKRLVNCKQVDVNQLMPLKYKWAWDYYNKGCANHWMPQEIPMQADIELWRSNHLTPNERLVMMRNLGFFSTGESLVGNNIVLAVFKHITNPEARQYLLRQAFEEAIHTHAFQYIVESLLLDQREVFNMYHEIPSIAEKDLFQIKLTSAIISDGFSTDSTDGLREFMRNLIGFYVIMEGIFFYSGFVMLLSFKRQNKLVGIGQQFEYIMRDECLMPTSEVLTPDGWIKIADLKSNTSVMTYKIDGSMEWDVPTRYVYSHFQGEMHHIYDHHDYYYTACTPGHRVPHINKHNELQISFAQSINLHPNMSLICTGKYIDKGLSLNCYEKLSIAIQSFKQILENGTQTSELAIDNGTIKISLHSSESIHYLMKILVSCHFHYQIIPDIEKKDVVIILIEIPVSSTWILSESFSCFSLMEFDSKKASEFIAELHRWYYWNCSHNCSQNNLTHPEVADIYYFCGKQSAVDKVQSIACLAGYRTKITKIEILGNDFESKKLDDDRYQLSIEKNISNISAKNIKNKKIAYDGFVYCITVASGMILSRYNGKVSVTGNSLHLNFGIDLINGIREENPDIWTLSFEQEIRQMIQDAVRLEIAYANDCMPNGILGLNSLACESYICYIADRRLNRLGMKEEYHTLNPFPWMSESTDLPRESNFFERKVVDYQQASTLIW